MRTADELANILADGFLESEVKNRALVGKIDHQGYNMAMEGIANAFHAAANIVRIYSPDKRKRKMFFIKKPIKVEAEQFKIGSPLPFANRGPYVHYDSGNQSYYVITIHGERATLADGDWVILENSDLFRAYPCKPNIFEEIYDAETNE